MTSLEVRALDWIVKNQEVLHLLFNNTADPLARELKEIAEAGVADRYLTTPGNRHIAVISVQDVHLPKAVIQNYVIRALKRYAETDEQKPFHGAPRPRFSVTFMPSLDSKEEMIRVIVQHTKRAHEAIGWMYEEVNL